jgi:hypothetical protein
LDRVVHAQHTIVTFLAEQGIGKPEWKKYRGTNQGQHDFQIDLGISLLNYGVGVDWVGVSEERPSYMQTGAFKPCGCKKCFFCLQGHTDGIPHCPQKQAKVTVEYKCGTRVTTKKCTHERVSLGLASGCYCWMSYRKQVTTELMPTERKNMQNLIIGVSHL